MFQSSVLSRTRIVTFTVLSGIASLMPCPNGWARSARPVPLRRGDAVGQALSAQFTDDEMRVRSSGPIEWRLGMRLTGWGYGEQLPRVTSGTTQTRGDRIEVRRGVIGSPASAPLVEWYVRKPEGLEQGFTLAAPPDALPSVGAPGQPGRLRLALELTGDLRGEMSRDGQAMLLMDPRRRQVARYDHLVAWDATGRVLASRMQVRGREVSLEVDDAGATYPVTVDPTITQEVKLTASNGAALNSFGDSVAISGSTAIVAASGRGAAYIFVRNGAEWNEQQRLPLVDAPSDGFGASVAISGNTAVVGAPAKDGGLGVAYVFVRSGSTWSPQGLDAAGTLPLISGDRAAGDSFGSSVAISGDTVIVGAPYKNKGRGAAYVFVRTGKTWGPAQKLPVNDRNPDLKDPPLGDHFGASVAISADTVLVGAPTDNVLGDSSSEGSAYVYVRNSGVWTEQSWLSSGETSGGEGPAFGLTVGLSGDKAIVGSFAYAAFVFERTGIVWSPPKELRPFDGEVKGGDRYGEAVAISGDLAIVGANASFFFPTTPRAGAAYLFRRVGGVWTEQSRLQASDSPPPPSAGTIDDRFGSSVALSGDTSIVGAPGKKVNTNRLQGGAYVFQLPDTDGDGLPDDWETNGVTIDGEFIDLRKMGANPNHKDIFVHVDWMQAQGSVVFKPQASALKMVMDAFAVAPVQNPDHRIGIRLHLDAGPGSIMNLATNANAKWGAFSRAGEVPFQSILGSLHPDGEYNWGAVDAVKLLHFGSKRGAVFHYALFGNDYAGANTSSGLSRDIPAADFIVTLGLWTPAGGSVKQQAGTFMHEFGHNLGLLHGGSDSINTKPNYLSIMNYAFQATGLLKANGRQQGFDFSRVKLANLDERNLDENVGINDQAGHLTLWSPRTRLNVPPGANKCIGNGNYTKFFFPSRALDWDCSGVKNAAPITTGLDINGDGICISGGPNGILDSTLGGDDEVRLRRIVSGPNRKCESVAAGDDVQEVSFNFVEPDLLTSFEDWSALAFDGGGKVGNARGAAEPDRMGTSLYEPTMEDVLDFVPPELLDEEALAPHDVFTTQAGGSPLAFAFDGSASTAVSGTIVKWEWDFGDGTTGSGATVAHTYDAPGEYFASLTVTDSNDHVNLVPLLEEVDVLDPTIATPTPEETPTPAPTPPAKANLTAYKLGAWADKLVVSDVQGTNTDGTTLVAGHTLFVDFAIINDGTDSTIVPFTAKLYVDGAEVHTFTVNPLVVFGYFYGEDFPIGPLVAGPHTVKIVADVNAAVAESDETDNEFSKAISVVPGGSTPTPSTLAATKTPSTTPLAPTPTAVISTPSAPTATASTPTPSPVTTPTSATPVSSPTPVLGPGDVDPTFITTATENRSGVVYAVVTQPDGKIIVGGAFESFAGCVGNGIARINVDGSCDSTFDPSLAFLNGERTQSHVEALALQPDGKILVGLFYARYADEIGQDPHRKALVRLNSDGTLDPSFDESGLDASRGGNGVEWLGVQSTGKILVGGSFVYDADTRANLVRLNADGSVDASFMLPTLYGGSFTVLDGIASASTAGMRVRGDDKILLYGGFAIGTLNQLRRNIARLNSDGSLDASFDANVSTTNPNGFPTIDSLSLQSGDKVIVAGDLFAGDGVTTYNIARLNSDGTRDASFVDAFVPANLSPTSTEVFLRRMSVAQPDGKVIVSGRFHLALPEQRNLIARLNTDGTLDTTFDAGLSGAAFTGAQSVNDVALQTNGKVVVVGTVDEAKGATAEDILQLNADGTRDPLFESNGPGADTDLKTLVRQPDGKLLVGYGALSSGSINKLNALRRNGIGRLDADGTADPTFTSPFAPGSNVKAIALQAGKIVVSGNCYLPGSLEPLTMARLSSNGALDPSFIPPSGAGSLSDIAVQPDGKLITYVGSSSTTTRIGRLNPDGGHDDTFPDINVIGSFDVIKLQADGRILVAGSFTGISRSSKFLERNNIARLEPDGTVDPTFDPGAGTGGDAYLSDVRTLIVQPDGRIIIGGDFSSYDGIARDRIARIEADGRLDTSFVPVNPDARSTNEGVDALALDSEGRVVAESPYSVVGQRFNRIFRLKSDGSIDSTFRLGSAVGTYSRVATLLMQPDDAVVIGGEFDTVNGVPRLSIARLLGSGLPPPTAENCYDCIDNDRDGAIDRDDSDCPQRADGMQLGLSLPGKGGKTIAKCAKTLGNAGLKFSGARLNHLQKCVTAMFVCVQQKPNDAACAAKAQTTCAKELNKAAADESKLRKSVRKACDAPTIDLADLKSVAGIGYETEAAVCAERGVGTLASANDVADCLVAQHECRTEDLLASEIPRAVELLRLAGRDPTVEFPCLVAGADGARADLGAAKGKLAVKCQKAIGKAGAKFASLKAKLTQKCLSTAYVCVQVKATDPKCRPKATATCNKQLAKLTAPAKGAVAKLAAAITKGCSKDPLALADILADGGLGFGALGGECAELGVPALDALADVSTCLERRHTCRVEQMIETEMPRFEELLEVAP